LSSWYDMDQKNLTLQGMEEGVKNSQCFILLLTNGVLTRPWVLIEFKFAVQNRKPILLVMEDDDKKVGYWDFSQTREWTDVLGGPCGKKGTKYTPPKEFEFLFDQKVPPPDFCNPNFRDCIPYQRRRYLVDSMIRELRQRAGIAYPDFSTTSSSLLDSSSKPGTTTVSSSSSSNVTSPINVKKAKEIISSALEFLFKQLRSRICQKVGKKPNVEYRKKNSVGDDGIPPSGNIKLDSVDILAAAFKVAGKQKNKLLTLIQNLQDLTNEAINKAAWQQFAAATQLHELDATAIAVKNWNKTGEHPLFHTLLVLVRNDELEDDY
jgi:hypothetical protein